jgi:hypothetical protein
MPGRCSSKCEGAAPQRHERRWTAVGVLRWIGFLTAMATAPYACGLGVNGLGEFNDANQEGTGPPDGAVSGPTEGDAGQSDAPAGSGDGASSLADCPAGLQNHVTACASSSPDCAQACGPELAGGGTLGLTTCSCNATTQVYDCAACVYPMPLPPCYALGNAPPTCPPRAANGVNCPKACDAANPGATPPCAFVNNTGKVDGCQCIMKTGGSKPVWTCAVRW